MKPTLNSFVSWLKDQMEEAAEHFDDGRIDVDSLREAGMLTNDKGIILNIKTTEGEKQFIITVQEG
ncbi:MAG: hypothetical protein ACXADW_21845 [Candidatus Hodarchaeales archaeon]|jgi:hypothetical protein